MTWLAGGVLYSVAYLVAGSYLRGNASALVWLRICALLMPPLVSILIIARRRREWIGCQWLFWATIALGLSTTAIGIVGWTVDEMLLDVRKALIAFVRQVHAVSPDAQISLMEFGQAAVTVVPFTTSDADLEKGVNRLSGKPRSASVLLEAINAASNNLARRPSPRRAIVALNIEPSDEQSREDPKRIVESLRKSVAQLWSLSIQKGPLKNPQRDVVLNVFTKNTGGAREFIVSRSAAESYLTKYADALTSQYEATYKRPAAKAQAVQIGTTRPGVRLHASGFAPL